MSPPWMPLYVADYLADTTRLSTVEHGAYMLLIMDYWRNGGLPADEAKLARIVRMTTAEWLTIRDSIAELFQDDWKHKRIDDEIEKASAKNDRRVEAGRRGGLAKAASEASNATILLEQQPSNALASSSQPESLATNVAKKETRERALFGSEFENEFWPAYPHKVGKGDALKAFNRARMRGELRPMIDGLRSYIAGKPADRPWCNPSTWLNQDRWLDQPAPNTGPNVLPFGTADPPRRQLSEAEQAERARKFNEDYAAGRIS